MKELLETLIKEKGLWKKLEADEVSTVSEDGTVYVYAIDTAVPYALNIWHIDTLREICKAKWGEKQSMGTLAWWFHFNTITHLESPQERENYLLNTN